MFLLLWTVLLVGMSDILPVHTDDRFTCCMSGWKEIRGVTMCPGPCCHGYEERVMDLPLLRRPTVCHKLTKEEITERRTAQALLKGNFLPNKTKTMEKLPSISSGKWMGGSREFAELVESSDDTQTPSVPKTEAKEVSQGVSEDEPNDPRRSEKAAFEFEDFLQRNKHFFIHLLSEGLSRKQIITGFEEFLNQMSSMSFQGGRWFRG